VFNRNEGDAESTAGSDVQLTILDSLYSNKELEVDVLDCSDSGLVKFNSINSINSKCITGLKVSGYIRRIFPITIFNTLIFLYKKKPELIVKYNLYIQQLIAIIIYKLIFKSKIIVIIQDYRQGSFFTLRQRWMDKLCLKLLRFVDYCLPITNYISMEIPLPDYRKCTYSGGITRSCKNIVFDDNNIMKRQAVFAGYLSEYNGLDKIIDFWLNNNIQIKLIIYGDGPLKKIVENSQQKNKNIVYKGKVNQKIVMEEIQRSTFYFCLRYNKGIDSKYFYPSKFFIGLYSSAILLYNRFDGLMNEFDLDFPYILNDEIDQLGNLLNINDTDLLRKMALQQQNLLKEHKTWENIISECLKKVTQL
jgi:hypothetical protein